MISLKRSKDDEYKGMPMESEYAWGTQITLEDEHVDQVQVEGLNIGDEVTLTAIAKVVSKSSNEDEVGPRKSLTFQVTDIDVHQMEAQGSSGEDAANILYRRQ